jgi:hypothetical protein
MAVETVKYIDGTEHTIDVNRLGFRRANQIAKKHIPISSLAFAKDGSSITISGDIDLIGLTASCLETVSGLDLDKLDGDDANRIFKKYFEKDVMGSLGQGADPN